MPRIITEETLMIPDSPPERGELVPQRLSEKLLQIRLAYGLSQGKMLLIVNPTERGENNRARVSQYERGERVPSLIELRNYARFAGVTMERLVDDQLDLPDLTERADSDCYTIHLSEIAAGHCKDIYLEQLATLPLRQMSLLSAERFPTYLLLAACDDYRERAADSALARRVRLLLGDTPAKTAIKPNLAESEQTEAGGIIEVGSDDAQ